MHKRAYYFLQKFAKSRFCFRIYFSGILTVFLVSFILCTLVKNGLCSDSPEWVNKYPVMPGYYIGIGFSNTGELNDDRIIAEKRAKIQIGGEICTVLRSELKIETIHENLQGTKTKLFEEINAVVEQHLKGVEIVDTYSHPENGYWVLARLSKARWKAQQEHDLAILRDRVLGAIQGGNKPSSLREELQRLSTGWTILHDSPLGDIVYGKIYGNNNYLSNAIYSRYLDIINSLSVGLDNNIITSDIDNIIEISGQVTGESKTGRLPVSLFSPDKQIAIVTTLSDEDGIFLLLIPGKEISRGENIFSVQVATDQLPFLYPLPPVESGAAPVQLTLNKKPALLRISFAGMANQAAAENHLRRLFSLNELPVDLNEKLDISTYSITAEFHFTDYPVVLDNAPRVSEGFISFTVKKGDITLYVLQSDKMREMGITRKQSHERVIASVFSDLEKNARYWEELSDAFLR